MISNLIFKNDLVEKVNILVELYLDSLEFSLFNYDF